ncbi:Nn.00g117070.m01.CDS01 [Neocucurbitaria sp. VM-36]
MKSKIVLPLYIYPHPGAWDPLYAAISAYPDTEFLVIINPNSGPGASPWWPNEDYVRELPRLNAVPSVTTVGYVRVTYCKRPITDVVQDVETYVSRSMSDELPGLEVEGIFVDETVNLFSKETKHYLDEIDRKVKDNDGIHGERIVIHNPGTAVNAQLARPGPDVTVVVETSYAHFMTDEYQEWLATSPYDRSRSCYMVHSVPEAEIDDFTTALRERAAYLFVTSAVSHFYESFGPSWDSFAAAIAKP